MSAPVRVHEAHSFDSKMQQLLVWDDFLGRIIKDEWTGAWVGSEAVLDGGLGGVLRQVTGGVSGNGRKISWNDIRSLHFNQRACWEARVKLTDITYVRHRMGLFFDYPNAIMFYTTENAGGAANWQIVTADDGGSSYLDSGIALDANWHIFRFESHFVGGNHVHFYIDDIETGNSPIAVNIPDDAADFLQPFFVIETLENAVKTWEIDYVVTRQDR